MKVDFINLTRGLYCCDPPNPHFTRIQSTWCEQKLWGDVLRGAGPDLLYHLAIGSKITLHDVSEKPRTTRAMWQGMSWVRYACERAWGARPITTAFMRSGHNATDYFGDVYDFLSVRTLTGVRYYAQFYRGQQLDYGICLAGTHRQAMKKYLELGEVAA